MFACAVCVTSTLSAWHHNYTIAKKVGNSGNTEETKSVILANILNVLFPSVISHQLPAAGSWRRKAKKVGDATSLTPACSGCCWLNSSLLGFTDGEKGRWQSEDGGREHTTDEGMTDVQKGKDDWLSKLDLWIRIWVQPKAEHRCSAALILVMKAGDCVCPMLILHPAPNTLWQFRIFPLSDLSFLSRLLWRCPIRCCFIIQIHVCTI